MEVSYILSPFKELFDTFLISTKKSDIVDNSYEMDITNTYFFNYPNTKIHKFYFDNEAEEFDDIEMNFENDLKFIENFFNGSKYFYFSISYRNLKELKELIFSIVLPKEFDYNKILINDSITEKIYTLEEYKNVNKIQVPKNNGFS